MKSPKFILVLLSALLWYGQLVANIHALGHIRADNDHSAHATAHHHHNANLSGMMDAAHAALHHDGANSSDNDKNAENNCEIYHAFANLSGVLFAVYIDHAMPSPWSPKPNYASSYVARVTLENHRIRAPPFYS